MSLYYIWKPSDIGQQSSRKTSENVVGNWLVHVWVLLWPSSILVKLDLLHCVWWLVVIARTFPLFVHPHPTRRGVWCPSQTVHRLTMIRRAFIVRVTVIMPFPFWLLVSCLVVTFVLGLMFILVSTRASCLLHGTELVLDARIPSSSDFGSSFRSVPSNVSLLVLSVAFTYWSMIKLPMSWNCPTARFVNNPDVLINP